MILLKYFNEYINESYLKGGRQPLYTWIINIDKLIETNELNITNPSYDKNFLKKDDTKQIKSISLTRSPHYYWIGDARIMLDTDKLIKDGYKSIPFDEISAVLNKSKKFNTSKPREHRGIRPPLHNLDLENDYSVNLENEYEERIYLDIKNIGKYIIYIDFMSYFDFPKELISKYIKKYPHIKARVIKTLQARKGNGIKSEIPSSKGEIILDINMIKDTEKSKNLKYHQG